MFLSTPDSPKNSLSLRMDKYIIELIGLDTCEDEPLWTTRETTVEDETRRGFLSVRAERGTM